MSSAIKIHTLLGYCGHQLSVVPQWFIDFSADPQPMEQYCELSGHESITLLPEGNGGAIKYKGQWKLLGDTGGAEGQNRTGYAGLFRAALYQ
jgi:hypothetical protein